MKLLVVEGLDGAGKSTQIRLLTEHLVSRGFKCEFLHFPRTDAPYFGELIARFLRGEFGSINEVDPWLVAMLYAGDRKDAAGQIRSWLTDGRIVLLDRYTYSNIAYQCAKVHDSELRDKLMKWITDLEFSHFMIPLPDLNIFLDVPFSFTRKLLSESRSGSDRAYLNGTLDIHEESIDFQHNVREMYLHVAKTDKRLCVVDCSDGKEQMLSPADISEKIINTIRSHNIL
jgi:dTMP kinase